MTETTETTTTRARARSALFVVLAVFALGFTARLTVAMARPEPDVLVALAAGVCAGLTILFIRAFVRAEIQASR